MKIATESQPKPFSALDLITLINFSNPPFKHDLRLNTCDSVPCFARACRIFCILRPRAQRPHRLQAFDRLDRDFKGVGTNVCVCVSARVCVSCVCVCVHVIDELMSVVCTSACMQVCTCACMHVCMCAHACMYVCMCAYLHVRRCAYACMHLSNSMILDTS